MKNLPAALMIVLTVAFAAAACTSSGDLRVLEDESWFDDFRVEEEQVYFDCIIVVENPGLDAKTFELDARADEADVGRLLKGASLEGYDADTGSLQFVIPAESRESFDVVFVGDYAGTSRKGNRLLPEVSITEVD